MHILIATDAQWVLNEIQAVFGSSSTTIQVVTNGRLVAPAVAERTPDIAILDMQVGSMGGMAITMDLRLDYSSGALPNVPILMLLDREADVHMARRSGANGWIIKPLDALRLRKAVNAIVAGGCYAEGIPVPEAIVEEVVASVDEAAEPAAELLNQYFSNLYRVQRSTFTQVVVRQEQRKSTIVRNSFVLTHTTHIAGVFAGS